MAEDLLAAVFPDAAACLENIAGDREVPDHLLARQTIADCLHDVMDVAMRATILERIQAGSCGWSPGTCRSLPAWRTKSERQVYAFLDDAPLEERRTQAVLHPAGAGAVGGGDLGALDQAAIDRVREEAWPDPRDPTRCTMRCS